MSLVTFSTLWCTLGLFVFLYFLYSEFTATILVYMPIFQNVT